MTENNKVVDAEEPLQEAPAEQQQAVTDDDFHVAALVGMDNKGEYSMRVLGRQKTFEGVLGLLEFMQAQVRTMTLQRFNGSPEVAMAQELTVLKNNMSMLMSVVQELKEQTKPQA